MARAANPFYYQNEGLGEALGQTLGRALFGDPEMRRKLEEHQATVALREAQAGQARAHALLYGNQAEGVGIQNNASRSLPELIASLFAQPQAAPAEAPGGEVDPLAPLADVDTGQPYYPGGFDSERFKAGLPALFAAMGQMKGDKIDPNGIVGGLAAMFGDDEFARRGLVAQGRSPSEHFAITPERADDIRRQEFGAAYDRAIDVEGIRSGDRRYNTDRDYDASIYSTDTRSRDTRRGQDIRSGDTRRGQDIRADGSFDAGAAAAIGGQFGTVTSTARTPEHNRRVGGVANSHHLTTRGGRAIDIARKPGVSHAQIEQAYRAAGYSIIESLDRGTHSHFAFAGGPKGGKAAQPKILSQPQMKALTTEVDAQIKDGPWQHVDSRARRIIRTRAIDNFQKSGNMPQAVADAIQWARDTQQQNDARAGKGKPAPQQAATPAKQDAGQLRQQALAAIGKGADPVKVRQRFKQMTGQNL